MSLYAPRSLNGTLYNNTDSSATQVRISDNN